MFQLRRKSFCQKLHETKKLLGPPKGGYKGEETCCKAGKKGIWFICNFLNKDDNSKGLRRSVMVDSGSNWSICPESLIPKQYRWSEVPIPENLNLVGISGGKLKGTVLAAAVIKIGEGGDRVRAKVYFSKSFVFQILNLCFPQRRCSSV